MEVLFVPHYSAAQSLMSLQTQDLPYPQTFGQPMLSSSQIWLQALAEPLGCYGQVRQVTSLDALID
jgi:hypothetical protein